MNRRQAVRLRRVSEYVDGSPSKYLFELLVPSTPKQLKDVAANQRAYDQELRPAHMVSAIRELQDAGVEPDVWKIEGRGESEPHVRAWLATAAAVAGFLGFAVGRTTFWAPLVALRAEKLSRVAAVAEVARRYRKWTDVFEQARSAASGSDIPPGTLQATVQLTGRTP